MGSTFREGRVEGVGVIFSDLDELRGSIFKSKLGFIFTFYVISFSAREFLEVFF